MHGTWKLLEKLNQSKNLNLTEIYQTIETEFAEFENELVTLMKSEIELSDKIFTYVTTIGGKRLRPALVLLSSKICGKTTKSSIKSAVAVELLHTATLIHDDVIDESPTRRGSDSVNKIWKNRLSVFTGDLMFAQTLKILTQLNDFQAINILAETAQKMTEGELLQIETKKQIDIPLEIYLKLIEAKTAVLFVASCKLGAISSEFANEKKILALENFAKNLGIAFQIKDDLLNFLGEQEKTGKPQGNDLLEGKLTLPMILALQNCHPLQKKEILKELKKGIDFQKLNFFINFIHKNSGIKNAELMAKKFVSEGEKSLEIFEPSIFKNALLSLLKFTVTREN
ncbi:polyprenyl synthetase family protein [bacterium]|nr:polyprenyl synthetase family protein [bacterium]